MYISKSKLHNVWFCSASNACILGNKWMNRHTIDLAVWCALCWCVASAAPVTSFSPWCLSTLALFLGVFTPRIEWRESVQSLLTLYDHDHIYLCVSDGIIVTMQWLSRSRNDQQKAYPCAVCGVCWCPNAELPLCSDLAAALALWISSSPFSLDSQLPILNGWCRGRSRASKVSININKTCRYLLAFHYSSLYWEKE